VLRTSKSPESRSRGPSVMMSIVGLLADDQGACDPCYSL
jgi:hypothetical protein